MCNDTFGTRAPETGGQSVGKGTTDVPFSQAVTGLAPGTYYYCALGSNATGSGSGAVMTFEVSAPANIPIDNEKGGCGCRVGTTAKGGSAFALVSLLLIALRRRRRQ